MPFFYGYPRDPEGGIPPGTAFEDLPEGWVCPACGVGVEHFEKEK